MEKELKKLINNMTPKQREQLHENINSISDKDLQKVITKEIETKVGEKYDFW